MMRITTPQMTGIQKLRCCGTAIFPHQRGLLGRRTYEIFAAHWPNAEGGEHDLIAKRFNSVTKYVATRSTMELTWAGSVALHDAAADVARLKGEDGPALVTQGSSDLRKRPHPQTGRRVRMGLQVSRADQTSALFTLRWWEKCAVFFASPHITLGRYRLVALTRSGDLFD
jgi:hypothetical protein